MRDKTIVVWVSCGAASAVAAKITIEKYGAKNKIILLNNPVVEEDEDNQRFLNDVSNWCSMPVEKVINLAYKSYSGS